MVALNFVVKSIVKLGRLFQSVIDFLVLRTRKSEGYISFSQETFELHAQKCIPNYKKNGADHKRTIPHHLGRYLSNNDTSVRDGAVIDIEQSSSQFDQLRILCHYKSCKWM